MSGLLETVKRMIMALFRLAGKILKFINPLRWLEKDMPLKGKIIIAVLLLVIFGGVGYGSFRFYDFTQNNPTIAITTPASISPPATHKVVGTTA